jgi:hypothetical protein
MTIGRRTNDEEKPISRVATIPWRDVDGSRTVTLTKPTLLVFEWDGHATTKVPREYSDRQIHDENQDTMVFIPMMEMKPGERAKHGPYVIEEVQLIAKDKTIAAAYAPDDGERDELVVVVQPTIEVAMSPAYDLRNLLHEVGFGESDVKVPRLFVETLERALLRRVGRFLNGANLRFIGTNGLSITAGLAIWIDCAPLGRPGDHKTVDFQDANGKTARTVIVNAVKIFQNLFLCHDQHLRAVQFEKADSRVYARNLLFGIRSDEGTAPRKAALSAFGRVGFPTDRRIVHRIEKNPVAVAPQGDAYSFEGAPNSSRSVEGDEVVGLVNDIDAAGCTVHVDPSTGVVEVSTMMPAAVPPRRASDIAIAINACAAWLSYVAAHELGHMLGASVTQSAKRKPPDALESIPMPDGASVGAYMNQDEEGEDPKPASAQLMSPSAHSFAQRLGLTGPTMTFLSQQAAYLRAVAPFASDFVRRNES